MERDGEADETRSAADWAKQSMEVVAIVCWTMSRTHFLS